MGQHALCAPSGWEKWGNCAAALAMEKGLPDNPNAYSDEGTAAHLLGSTCLETGGNPDAYLDRAIVVGSATDFDGALWDVKSPDMTVRREYIVDQEMADHVAKYVNRVREYAANGGTLHAEQRISIETFTGEAGAAGTSDAVVTRPLELTVIDLKYGMGVRVDAERNGQLMIYALGVREEMDLAYGPFAKIRFVISQPRLDHLSEWDCAAEELDAFGEEVKKASARALDLYDTGEQALLPEFDFAPSQDTCRWCRAKATCPELAKFVADAAGADFEAFTVDPVGITEVPGAITDISGLAPALLSRKMGSIGLIEDWCKAIRAEVERQLFAGIVIPGYKIVGGKKGNRSWKDEEEAEKLFREMRMTVEERCNLTLKSPTQIEKVLKPTPKRLARLNKADLITQVDGKPSVAPESDKRPAWAPPDAAADFTATTEENVT